MAKLSLNGIPIMTYRWLGTGETILLAHGWESNAARWQYLIEPLKKMNYNIIALDAPAHGRSGSNRFNAVLYADFINSVSQKFKPDIIIGHSVGGMASAYFQSKSQNIAIKKLVLLGAPSEFTDVLKRYFKLMGYNKRTKLAFNALIQKRFNTEPVSFSTAKSLKNMVSKGLIIHDEHDTIIPYKDALEIQSHYKNSRLVTTNGFGHSLKDTRVSEYIYEFLEA